MFTRFRPTPIRSKSNLNHLVIKNQNYSTSASTIREKVTVTFVEMSLLEIGRLKRLINWMDGHGPSWTVNPVDSTSIGLTGCFPFSYIFSDSFSLIAYISGYFQLCTRYNCSNINTIVPSQKSFVNSILAKNGWAKILYRDDQMSVLLVPKWEFEISNRSILGPMRCFIGWDSCICKTYSNKVISVKQD